MIKDTFLALQLRESRRTKSKRRASGSSFNPSRWLTEVLCDEYKYITRQTCTCSHTDWFQHERLSSHTLAKASFHIMNNCSNKISCENGCEKHEKRLKFHTVTNNWHKQICIVMRCRKMGEGREQTVTTSRVCSNWSVIIAPSDRCVTPTTTNARLMLIIHC